MTERLEGNVYVLLAEVSTRQEQCRCTVSDSLTRAIKEYGRNSGGFPFFDRPSRVDKQRIPLEDFEVLPFRGLANKLNETGLSQRYADMRDFFSRKWLIPESRLGIPGQGDRG